MATVYEIIQGINQAAANASWDGAHEESLQADAKARTAGLQREDGHYINDRRVMDGFNVKFMGPVLRLTYQAETRIKEVQDRISLPFLIENPSPYVQLPGEMSEIELGNVADAGQTIVGSKMGSVELQVDVPKLVQLYQQGDLKLNELVTACYPLEEINEAIDAVNRGDALRNVILL